MSKRKINKKSLSMLIIFLSIILLQSMIFMSFDDYGYATISYAVGNQFNPNGGVDYSFFDVLKFLKATYMIWAGRIFDQFLLIECLKNGERFIQLIQTIVIFFTIFFTVKVFSKKENFIRNFVLVTMMFFSIPIIITKLSLFWYCASVIYFWPFLFFVLGLFLLKRKDWRKTNSFYKIILLALGIISGWSQEQVGMAFCVFMFTTICWEYIFDNKNINKNKILFFIGNIIGYSILMIAPGNFARMSTDSDKNFLLNSFEVVKELIWNFKYINNNIVYISIIAFLLILLNSRISKKESVEKLKKVSMIIIILTQIIIMISKFTDIGKINYIALIFHFLFMIFAIIIYIVLYKDKIIAALSCAAVASLIPILISPYFVHRMLFPIYYINIIILLVLLENVQVNVEAIKYIKIKNVMLYMILLVGVIKYSLTVYGYFENSIPKNINNKILREAKQKIDQGGAVDTIYLYKNMNERYTGTQPYEVDYTGSIKNYFKIPQNVNISFEPFPEDNPIKALKIINKKGIEGLENSTFIKEIDGLNSKKDLSKFLKGFYGLEVYENESFYWVQKNIECKLENDLISKNGLKIKFNVNKENLLKNNPDLKHIKWKIRINGIEVKEVDIMGGNQQISLHPNEFRIAQDNVYKIELQSNCDFSPKEIGNGDDGRRLFAQVYYIGNN